MPHRPPSAATDPNRAGLQLDQNLRQQRGEWWLQRAAWVLFALLIAAYGVGLIGPGPLSHERRASPDGALQVDFPRFLRRHTTEMIELQVQPRGERVRLRLDGGFLGKVDVENVFPEPQEMSAAPDATMLEYRVSRGARLMVQLQLRPESAGRLHGWVALDDGAPLRFDQIVLP